MAVFVSILFMGGIVERLFREFSITLVAAIMISLLVSLTLTPMLCARWLRAAEARAAEPAGSARATRLQARCWHGYDAQPGLGAGARR